MIRELLLVHHSHTDIGYTHSQAAVFELHHRFIEEALDLIEASAQEPDDARLRWTCEVTGVTRAWWDQASEVDRRRFRAAATDGRLEVAAMEWHLTPLADVATLIRSLDNVRFFRSQGLAVRSAMNTDINGVPWSLVDVLLDHEIVGFSMSANSHFGAPVLPRPGAFWWASPSGRRILTWNGYQYWHVANGLLQIPSTIEAVSRELPRVLQETEARGYALPFLPLQITNRHHPDNAGPDADLSAFVREWNSREPDVRLRIVLLSEVFDRLRDLPLPTLSGDWTDYWNFGAGSSARETAVLMEGQRALETAHQMDVWCGDLPARTGQQFDEAQAQLSLYAEHTWGADCSIRAPESTETRLQWATKSAYAYQGLSRARIVERDGLHKLALKAGGDGTRLLLYNSLPVPVRRPVLLPTGGLEWATNAGVHHSQRLDGALTALAADEQRWCDVELPANGYRVYSLADLPFATSDRLSATARSLTSSRIELTFMEAGGVASMRVDGTEYIGEVEGFTFGVPILERPKGGTRGEIMSLDFTKLEPAEGWRTNWPRTTTPGTMIESTTHVTQGAVEHREAFAMANDDVVRVVYRLFANDSTVDVEVNLRSAGDVRPYSLALPFTLPLRGRTIWHFDTAGAIVEFDREQLPNSARHFVTSRRFVRMQTGAATLSISTPDLPLWKFGGMFFAPTDELDPATRQPVMLAWLANNYWEVNFLASQTGEVRYRLRLVPGGIEEIDESYLRALPYSASPALHPYRGLGAERQTSQQLFEIESDGVSVEIVERRGEDLTVVLMNLRSAASCVHLRPGVFRWTEAWRARLDGTPTDRLPCDPAGDCQLSIQPRELVAVRLRP